MKGSSSCDLLPEGQERRALAGPQTVQEGPSRAPQRVQLRAPHASAHVQREHRVDGRLLLEDRLQLPRTPPVAQLEIGRGQAPHGLAPARDEHLDPDDTHFRAEDRRRLGGGEGEERADEQNAHRPSASFQSRSRLAWAWPGGPNR